MRGRYYSLSIGETLSTLKVLKKNNTGVLNILKSNWLNLFDNWEPVAFCDKTHTLTVQTSSIVIYMDHLKVSIMQKCNNFLGGDVVHKIKWRKARI